MNARIGLWLIAAQSVWAGSYVAMKFAGAEMPVGAVVILRYGLAALLFIPIFWRRGIPRYARRDWLWIAALGGVNFTVSPSLQVASLRYTQALDISILVAIEPLITVLFAGLLLGEKITARTVAAGALSLAGVLILSGVGEPGAFTAQHRLAGNALYFLALLCEVSVTIAGARLSKVYDPIVTMGLLKTAGFLVGCMVYFGVWNDVEWSAVSQRAWISVAYLSAAASLFGYSVWYWLLRTAPVQKMALSLFLQPIAGTAAGVLLAGEIVGPNTLLGAALIFAGLAWQEVRPTPRRPLGAGPV